MNPILKRLLICLWCTLITFHFAWGQPSRPTGPDLTRQPTLYIVPYAHLDTQWRWDYAQTIGKFIPRTMHDNFALFQKYPHYIFNFSGANRYRMMKEYYPADFGKVKEYVKAGRWFPSGSSMEENDVNSPSAESIIRQILYGKEFFRREFGKTSMEFMLPDCFGFPASLPSILAHVGIKGFSTQKLSWHSGAAVGGPNSPEKTPYGIPFNVGYWVGTDGKGVIAALNAMDYSGDVSYDLSKSPTPTAGPSAHNAQTDWVQRVQIDGKVSGLYTDYHYYGTGDIGGAPRESSVKLMEAIVTKSETTLPASPSRPQEGQAQQSAQNPAPSVRVGEGPLHIVQATAEQMFLDIKRGQMSRLPRYKGDLELTEHSAGSLTSEAYLKRWNRKNELLADAAERASVAAAWLGARTYPLERLNNAWTLVMGGQFHDILPGTSIPRAYEYSWNDELLAMNQFADVVTSATEGVVGAMNTQIQGVAIVVYNPLNVAREDVAEAKISWPNGVPAAVRVVGPDGKETPAQIEGDKVLFVAKVPSVGYAVYDVQPATKDSPSTTLLITDRSLENARYRIQVNVDGDIASIYDKILRKELLSSPARLALKTDKPVDWPAWNMDWADQQKPPRAFVSGPTRIRIVEHGPVRVGLEIERETDGSKFLQTVRLSAGDAGNRVEIFNIIDWKTSATNLKATFPLTASNPVATYNWDIGTIERPNDQEKMFEYPSHQWVDLTDQSGAFGMTILTDCKNASDKPNDNTLQLTLLRTPGLGTHPDGSPGNGRDFIDQTTQDWGRHEFIYGLVGHAGDWRKGQTDWQAKRLNQPLMAFESSKHPGFLGKNFSLLKINNDRLGVLALKKAEKSDEIVVRLVELNGKPERNVTIAFSAPILAAREMNGAEEAAGPANVKQGKLVADFGPYQPHTFAVTLQPPTTNAPVTLSRPVALPYNRSVVSKDGEKSAPGFDSPGNALPAEMLPNKISYNHIAFKLAPVAEGKGDAVVPRGQKINLPTGKYSRLYILAAAADGDQKATFNIGGKAVDLTIQDWGGFIGQWDTRLWNEKEEPVPTRAGAPTLLAGTSPMTRKVMEYAGLTPGYVKPAPVAWFASHHHTAGGANVPYGYSYLFAYRIDLPPDSHTVTLPDNNKIRILALTVSNETGKVDPAEALSDTLERSK